MCFVHCISVCIFTYIPSPSADMASTGVLGPLLPPGSALLLPGSLIPPGAFHFLPFALLPLILWKPPIPPRQSTWIARTKMSTD